jgi:hypothetical protein
LPLLGQVVRLKVTESLDQILSVTEKNLRFEEVELPAGYTKPEIAMTSRWIEFSRTTARSERRTHPAHLIPHSHRGRLTALLNQM